MNYTLLKIVLWVLLCIPIILVGYYLFVSLAKDAKPKKKVEPNKTAPVKRKDIFKE